MKHCLYERKDHAPYTDEQGFFEEELQTRNSSKQKKPETRPDEGRRAYVEKPE